MTLFTKGHFFQPVIAALHRGVGMQNLQEIRLENCALGDAHCGGFVQTLEGSTCAERMVTLWFQSCEIGVEGALANLLRWDRLPALKDLFLLGNFEMGDEGVAALASGLGEVPRTMLTWLDLNCTGMGDVGMAALASAIHQGRMQENEYIDLGEPGVTDKGLIASAQSIDASAQIAASRDRAFNDENYTAVGFGAITLAFVKGCPRLNIMPLMCPDRAKSRSFLNFLNTMIQGIFQAAGRTAKVSV